MLCLDRVFACSFLRLGDGEISGDVDMASEIIFVVQESPEGGYEARALGHSIFTEADSLEELQLMVRDAVACHFEKEDRPKIIRLQQVARHS